MILLGGDCMKTIGYIIRKKNEHKFYLKNKGKGDWVWQNEDEMPIHKLLKRYLCPSIFVSMEDAFSFAYNVAHLSNEEFDIDKTTV